MREDSLPPPEQLTKLIVPTKKNKIFLSSFNKENRNSDQEYSRMIKNKFFKFIYFHSIISIHSPAIPTVTPTLLPLYGNASID